MMRRGFVPSSYPRDLRNRLQVLKQGKRSVDEYFKEMELLLVRAGIREDSESKMAIFLAGLNEEISDLLRCFPTVLCKILLNRPSIQKGKFSKSFVGNLMAVILLLLHGTNSSIVLLLVEAPRSAAKSFPSNGTSKKEVSSASSPANQQRPAANSAAQSVASGAASSTRSREIVCHKCHGRGHIAAQCPSRRTMLLNEKGEWESESDPEDEGPKFDEEIEEENAIEPDEGEHNCFISLRVLSVTAEKEDSGQQHNLFHTRGMIKDKLCRIIVDNGSCNNIASEEFVDRLGLKSRRHPSPYKMQWLNDCGALCVSHIVSVPFSVGKYNDHVECDVVPMQACQLLLGRPWLYDCDVLIF